MLYGFRRVVLAGRRWLVLGGLCFQRFFTVKTARTAFLLAAQAHDHKSTDTKQLLVDVSVIARDDARTGIQRVVRAILRQLITNPPPDYDVKPVYASRRHGYRYAQQYGAALMGHDLGDITSRPVHAHAGDVFLGLDLASHSLVRHHRQIRRWKIAGVKFFFVVHDLLPVLHPDWFTAKAVKAYVAWIRTVAIYADGAICVSKTVSNDLQKWLSSQCQLHNGEISVEWFHLGGDIKSSMPSYGRTPEFDELVSRICTRVSILMVGTIDPRKGYGHALAAFESLWEQGEDVNLVIVGKAGWNVETLVSRLRNHPESGSRLFWLDNATDEMLEALYGATAGLLMASEAEGFGLPIVEVAKYAKPILLRDIPVFREIAKANAHYFRSGSHTDLADELMKWIELIRQNKAIVSTEIGVHSWEKSAKQLLFKLESLVSKSNRL